MILRDYHIFSITFDNQLLPYTPFTSTPQTPKFCQYCSILVISFWVTPKWTSRPLSTWSMHQKCTKIFFYTLLHHQGSNFHPFWSTNSCFQLTGRFWDKCTEWPPTDIHMVEVKCTVPMPTCTLEEQIFISSFYDEPFWSTGQVWVKFTEWPQSNLDMSMVKSTHTMHFTYNHAAQIFSRTSLYNEPFWR